MTDTPTGAAPKSLRAYLDREGAPTQRQLADLAGVHQSMISMIASGQRAAGGRLALRLHALTEVPLEALVLPRRPRRRPRPTSPTTTPMTTHALT